MAEVGDHAPDFELPSTAGTVRLSDMTWRGPVILAFYAEDNTPLCSNQVSMLKDDYETIRELGADVLAISSDSLESHRAFAERLGGVPFPLATDERLHVAHVFAVADEETKRCRRAVFVIGAEDIVKHAERWFQPGNPDPYEAIGRALGFRG